MAKSIIQLALEYIKKGRPITIRKGKHVGYGPKEKLRR